MIRIGHCRMPVVSLRNSMTDNLFKLLLDILTDDKYYMVEACFNRIMNREIHDDMCLILKTYFYINDEESENIKNMSRSQIQTVIEDSINRHDSQGDIK